MHAEQDELITRIGPGTPCGHGSEGGSEAIEPYLSSKFGARAGL